MPTVCQKLNHFLNFDEHNVIYREGGRRRRRGGETAAVAGEGARGRTKHARTGPSLPACDLPPSPPPSSRRLPPQHGPGGVRGREWGCPLAMAPTSRTGAEGRARLSNT